MAAEEKAVQVKAKSSWWIKFHGVSNRYQWQEVEGYINADGVFIKNYAEIGVGDFCIVQVELMRNTRCVGTPGSDQVSVPNEDGTEVVFAGLYTTAMTTPMRCVMSGRQCNALRRYCEARLPRLIPRLFQGLSTTSM